MRGSESGDFDYALCPLHNISTKDRDDGSLSYFPSMRTNKLHQQKRDKT